MRDVLWGPRISPPDVARIESQPVNDAQVAEIVARDHIAHGVRVRAQGLITLNPGPETDVERMQTLIDAHRAERLCDGSASPSGYPQDSPRWVTLPTGSLVFGGVGAEEMVLVV